MASCFQRTTQVQPARQSPLTEFKRAGQIEIAPRCRFRLVPKLLISVREQLLGGHIIGIGEYDMVHNLGNPSVLPLVERSLGLTEDVVCSSHEGDVAAG